MTHQQQNLQFEPAYDKVCSQVVEAGFEHSQFILSTVRLGEFLKSKDETLFPFL
jgi:hypothetical protein